MNQFRIPEAAAQKIKSPLKRLHDFDFLLNRTTTGRIIPFILFISVWAIIYIANHHYGEKTLGQMNDIRKDLKDLKADFYTINAELSNRSIQSEVSKMVEPIGLQELRQPPKRLKLIQE